MDKESAKAKAKATREHRAMTTQAMRALKEREQAKREAADKAKAGGDSTQKLLMILGALVVLFIVVSVVFTSEPGDGGPRDGEEKGAQRALEHIEQKHFVLHVIEGQQTGVKDHGKGWESVLRNELRLKVYITRHKAESVDRQGWLDYCKAYNLKMLEHLRENLGADFLEKAKHKAAKRG